MVEAPELAKPAQHWRLKTTFWLDMTLLVSVCVLQTVRFTGLVLHEWLGLAMVGMVLAHLLLSWSWIATQSRRLFARQSARERVNYLINLVFLGSVTAVIFSGILISQKAIPTLTGAKITPGMDWRWDSLHNEFSQAVILLAGFTWRSIGTGRSRPYRSCSLGLRRCRKDSAVSGKARCEIGVPIIAARPSLTGGRRVCSVDGNLWPFRTASFAQSALAS
jgi:hypothetical protein